MISDSLAFEINLDPAETVRASQEIARRGGGSTAARAATFWLVLIATFFLVFKGGMVVAAIVGVVLGLCGLYALLWPIIQRRRLRRFYTGTPTLSGPQRYKFTDDGLALSNAGAESLLRWPAVLEAAETPEFFLLYYSKKCAYYLPKRIVGSDITQDELRTFLRAKLSERAAHLAPPT